MGNDRISGAVCAFLFTCVALLPAGCGGPGGEVPSPEGRRLLFVGIDGATWTVMGPMIDNGELPSFQRLMDEGAFMEEFGTMETTASPVVWTTVATGQRAAVHGVEGFSTELADGTEIPPTSSQRRARAIWEIASRRGGSVGVLGWWASWPAEEVDGYVVTDLGNPAFGETLEKERRPTEIVSDERDVYPAGLAPGLADRWVRQDDFPWAELQRRGGFTDAQMAAARAAQWDEDDVYAWLKTFFAVDTGIFRQALALAEERPVDLQMVYFRAADPVQHYGWDLVEPEAFPEPPENLERDRGLVEGTYRYVDTFLGELMATQRPGDWLIVASDHGASASAQAGMPGRWGRPGTHNPSNRGVLFLRGAGVQPGERLSEADPYDLFPTMAWLLGLPVAEDLPGEPLFDAFDRRFVRSLPVKTVGTYGPRPPQPLVSSPADEAMLENLRGLGYLD